MIPDQLKSRLRRDRPMTTITLHLPEDVIEAALFNVSTLRSQTCFRLDDGNFFVWEGCNDRSGCCFGSCTHVWNYAQAIPHLFPALERTLRETEFTASQNEPGHQNFRTSLPIQPVETHNFHAAADGQLGDWFSRLGRPHQQAVFKVRQSLCPAPLHD